MPGFQRLRFPLVVVALLALLAGMWVGLQRMGWDLPPLGGASPAEHGGLMIAGFLGTLISLERSVALGRPWTYAPPVLAALGGLALLAGLPLPISILLMTLSSLGLIAVFVLIVRQQPALFTRMMLIGAGAWFVGNLLELAGLPIYRIVYWWCGFLVLTIVGERLELSRLRRLRPRDERFFLAAALLFMAGVVLATSLPDPGVRIAGAGLLALAAWLLRYDLARRTVRQAGLTRYIAVCMLGGYFWLALSGLLALYFGPIPAGPIYDAILHTLLVGFVLGMIFGHAPLILPAVLKFAMAYRPVFYVPLVLLYLSLALRVTGDLAGLLAVRQWGGMLNALSVLVFLGMAAGSVLAGRGGRGV
jgi:hypothetical protein